VEGQPATATPVLAATDREAAPLAFLLEAARQGIAGAVVTISRIEGGAPKALGTQMAVLADGRHVGHVSGGCVEPAIAAEVVPVIAEGRDRTLRFGTGSPYLDIRFPCGGGVDLLVHAAPQLGMLEEAVARLARRVPFSILFDPATSSSRLADDLSPTAWSGTTFRRRYLPRTRLLLVGRGPELEVLARVAAASELDLVLGTPDESSASALAGLGAPITLLAMPDQVWDLPIDRWTATVLVFHEHEWEDAILSRAAAAVGFYVGALGSLKTHRLRRERLAANGVPDEQLARIRGPIGVIDRAREPGVLAVSVLAEIAAARAERDRT
jgi:xanthine dehydrogenase accessory factor